MAWSIICFHLPKSVSQSEEELAQTKFFVLLWKTINFNYQLVIKLTIVKVVRE